MSATDIFRRGEVVLFKGRAWKIHSCFRNQVLLERTYPKAKVRDTSRQTYGTTYTFQRYNQIEKVPA